MIIQYLVRRNRRERWLLGLTVLVLSVVACYVATIGPAREAVADHESQLVSARANLDLQQRQLTLLRAETAGARRSLEELSGAAAPWVNARRADALLQEWQNLASEVGLTLQSVTRENQAALRLDIGAAHVSSVAVRLEVRGPYANVMALLDRLDDGTHAVGLEDLDVRVGEEPPFDLAVTLVVRLGLTNEEAPHAGT
ncbi:MAG TPA: type II secretion system protein GspM [Phycisphaerae bacterium]|nr:type II secretion system protein GspM [Phycisphaerae bacterium]